MLDGRVKTLHPKVHGGLLFIRGNSDHEAAAAAHHIAPIDLVVVNLYPFEATVARPDVSLHEAIENIDIGGPSMLRSAAKNHESVTVDHRSDRLRRSRRPLSPPMGTPPWNFAGVSPPRSMLAPPPTTPLSPHYLQARLGPPQRPAPASLTLSAPLAQTLRYGENPHQKAALYGRFTESFEQCHGKELSYNNILDLTAAASLIAEFAHESPTLAILKHTNPCGVGQGPSLREAWDRAFATDRQAPFGGIIATNRTLDLACAEAIAEIFSEVIVAPDFHPDALELLHKKKNLRLIRIKPKTGPIQPWDLRSVGFESYLLQERDTQGTTASDLKIVTQRSPNSAERHAMLFGWRIVKHVKSNAIVYVTADDRGHGRTLGIGAGQMSRVDASRIAVWKAGEAGLSLAGSVVCSDAFFPFPDGLIAAAEAGATAAIHPGGSVRDSEVNQAADARGVAMVHTGVRHFRH
jgi:phosphoribosylaminoimidazolecarboxamide formyltransferase/IMP cyclohydrolase